LCERIEKMKIFFGFSIDKLKNKCYNIYSRLKQGELLF
jgi:hypothetical protein